jgi:hypothetical protein
MTHLGVRKCFDVHFRITPSKGREQEMRLPEIMPRKVCAVVNIMKEWDSPPVSHHSHELNPPSLLRLLRTAASTQLSTRANASVISV